ncbi:MAG: S24 family peptidase [Gammaproteobacteria bacterium]|nr:S24 family peptidase [Gammaproteobacteria bacterium]
MSESKIIEIKAVGQNAPRLEPSTCVEAETFALQVLDDSMEPEFRKGCIVIVDPTGRATDGSFVLAKKQTSSESNGSTTAQDESELVGTFMLRQLRKDSDFQWQLCPLNSEYSCAATSADFSDIVGVITQRAGTRRRYHKRYD